MIYLLRIFEQKITKQIASKISTQFQITWVVYVFLDHKQKGVKETKISALLVQRLSTEPKPTTMKYSQEGPRDFVPFEYEEVTIDNIKKACQKHFKEHRNCDVLASEQGPSCSRIDQLPSFKIIHIRFMNDLSRKLLFPEMSSFSKTSDISGISSKRPKAFVLFQNKSRNVLHLFSQKVYQQRICCD